jgi:hypothetical protein
VKRLLAAVRLEEWIAAGYAAAVATLLTAFGLRISLAAVGREYGKFLLAIAIITLPFWFLFRRRDSGAAATRPWTARGLGELLRPLVTFWIVLIAYTNLKSRITFFNPRLLDEPLLDLDALFHFGGGDFLGWLLSFTHESGATRFWGYVYFFAWAALALPFGVAYARGGAAATRRIALALGLVYIAGSLLYLAFPSLGPAFAFRPRFAHLAGSAGHSVQEAMLANFLALAQSAHQRPVPFFGIAAFPSLHLATTGIGLFAAARFSRPLLALLVPWNLAIAWSALYFGWHYAIDFYPGLLLAWGGWWLSGKLLPDAAPRAENGRP